MKTTLYDTVSCKNRVILNVRCVVLRVVGVEISLSPSPLQCVRVRVRVRVRVGVCLRAWSEPQHWLSAYVLEYTPFLIISINSCLK